MDWVYILKVIGVFAVIINSMIIVVSLCVYIKEIDE